MTRPARILFFPSHRAPHHEGTDLPGGASTSGPLTGRTVLLVEDDFIVGYDMQTLLEEQGASVFGPATSVDEALQLLSTHSPTVAVLDVNLNGEFVFPLAVELQARGIPFVFATAYADDDKLFPEAVQGVPRLAKPVLPNALISQLRKLLGS
jgi:CheY-like chemotaxis protein